MSFICNILSSHREYPTTFQVMFNDFIDRLLFFNISFLFLASEFNKKICLKIIFLRVNIFISFQPCRCLSVYGHWSPSLWSVTLPSADHWSREDGKHSSMLTKWLPWFGQPVLRGMRQFSLFRGWKVYGMVRF